MHQENQTNNETPTQGDNPFIIDYENRKIQVLPGVNIAVNSRKFLKLTEDFLPSGVLKADATVVVVAGDASETTLNSYVVPLNTISRNYSGAASASGPQKYRDAGNTFRVWAAGVYTTDDSTATVAIKLELNNGAADTTYHTITTTGATVTNAPWYIDWMFIVSAIGSSGTAETYVTAKTNNVNKDVGGTSALTLDTTLAQTIKMTATWASGDAADSISIRQFLIELIN